VSNHFRIVARLDMASRAQEGTLTIDRVAGLAHVRPLRRSKFYSMPLAEVASWIVRSQLAAEAREHRARRRHA